MRRANKRESGFALVGAIFLVVILAALGVFAVTLSGVQHATNSQAVIASRTYYGAKAGLEWGIQQAIAASSCAASTTFSPSGAGLSGISVTVTCTSHASGVFYLTSTGTYGTFGGPEYSQRVIEATVGS